MRNIFKIYKIYYLLFFPIYLLIRIISPFSLLRFERLISNRIGHFACTTELYLCEIENKINIPKQKYKDIFTINDEISNAQIYKFWKKKIFILNHFFVDPILFFIRIIPGSNIHRVFYRKKIEDEKNMFSHRDLLNLIDRSSIHYSFEENEIKTCINLCKKLNIPINKKIALIHLRDDFYFKKFHPNKDFSYWEQKNPNLNDYIPSILHLIKNNYYVIRVGKGSQKKIRLKNKKYLDLTNDSLRTDLLESFLISRSKLFIGPNSGAWITASYLYRKYTYTPNFMPIGALYSYSKKMHCNFRRLKKNNNKIVKLSEIKKFGLLKYEHTESYKALGLKFEDFSPNELKEYVDEFMLKVEKKWKVTNEEIKIKKAFIKHFLEQTKDLKINGDFRCEIGYRYLKNNSKWLLS